jgi:hypothetical protein
LFVSAQSAAVAHFETIVTRRSISSGLLRRTSKSFGQIGERQMSVNKISDSSRQWTAAEWRKLPSIEREAHLAAAAELAGKNTATTRLDRVDACGTRF